MFKKIICATDLSNLDPNSIVKAVQLASQFDATLILLKVFEEFMNKDEMEMLRIKVDSVQAVYEEKALKAKSKMKAIIDKCSQDNLQTKYPIKEGKASKVIFQEAANEKADMIVLGASHKANSLSKLILGTTAS
jgi:nucleotide-binding universal stress UspA family protein